MVKSSINSRFRTSDQHTLNVDIYVLYKTGGLFIKSAENSDWNKVGLHLFMERKEAGSRLSCSVWLRFLQASIGKISTKTYWKCYLRQNIQVSSVPTLSSEVNQQYSNVKRISPTVCFLSPPSIKVGGFFLWYCVIHLSFIPSVVILPFCLCKLQINLCSFLPHGFSGINFNTLTPHGLKKTH